MTSKGFSQSLYSSSLQSEAVDVDSNDTILSSHAFSLAAAVSAASSPEVVITAAASGDQHSAPAIAGLSDGGSIVVWSDRVFYTNSSNTAYDSGNVQIRGQLINSDGTVRGSVFNITGYYIDPNAGFSYPPPTVAGLANGRSVVVFTYPSQPNATQLNTYVKAQFLNADGTTSGNPIEADPATFKDPSTIGKYDQGNVAALSDGGAVVVSRFLNSSGFTVLQGQRFGVGGAVVAGSTAIGGQPDASVTDQNPFAAGLASGGYVVAYAEIDAFNAKTGTDTNGIYLQRFNGGGASIGTPIKVNTAIAQRYRGLDNPAVAVLQDGSFVVVYRSEPASSTATASLFAQRFSAAGVAVGSEVSVTTNASIGSSSPDQSNAPTISGLQNGGYVVAWTAPATGSAPSTIQAQLFSTNGTAQGSTLTISPAGTGFYSSPGSAISGNGNLLIADRVYNGSASNFDIRLDNAGPRAAGPYTLDNGDGTSTRYVLSPNATVLKAITHFAGLGGAGAVLSDIIDNADLTSLIYAYSPTATVKQTASRYTATDPNNGAPAGSKISVVINSTDGTTLVYAYNPTSTVNQTTNKFSATNPDGSSAGTQISAVVANTDGTALVYAYNPTTTVKQVTTRFSATDPANGAPTGARLSDVVDNVDGTALVYAYNVNSAIKLTASLYSGTDPSNGAPTGRLATLTVDYTTNQSSVQSFNADGTSSTTYYSGLDGTGSVIPGLSGSAMDQAAPIVPGSLGVGAAPTQFMNAAAAPALIPTPGIIGFDASANRFDLSALLASDRVTLAYQSGGGDAGTALPFGTSPAALLPGLGGTVTDATMLMLKGA